jgi:hypothetical protein
MSTRHEVPTTFALVTVGQPFATAFDAEPTHTKASSLHAHTVGRGLPVAFEPDARVFVTTLASRYFDVVVVFDDGRTARLDVHKSTFGEALTAAYDAVIWKRSGGRGPQAVAAVLVDREQPDTMLRTRLVDLRVVRPHACDEGCTGCWTCYAATGTTRCTAVCPHAPAAPEADDAPAPRVVVSVEFFAREQAGRAAGSARSYDIVEATTHDDGTTCERVVEGGFFALSAADGAAAEYKRDHDRDVRRRAAAATTGGAR